MFPSKPKKKVVSFSLDESQYDIFRKTSKLLGIKQSSLIDGYIKIRNLEVKDSVLPQLEEYKKNNQLDDNQLRLLGELKYFLDEIKGLLNYE